MILSELGQSILPRSSLRRCDVKQCAARSITPAEPTLATCDLQRSNFMAPLSSEAVHSSRGWAVYRRTSWAGPPTWPNGTQAAWLPCTPPCRLRWSNAHAASNAAREWFVLGGVESAVMGAQRRARPPWCVEYGCS